TTGLTPYEKQGQSFEIVEVAPPVGSPAQPIRITGFGTTGTGVPREWNQAQKTHVGPYFAKTGTQLQYQTDTTGGNSGSPVIDDSTGMAIGIHTPGGHSPTSGTRRTRRGNGALHGALAAPSGVCGPTVPLPEFT